jgi:hypothetical protein
MTFWNVGWETASGGGPSAIGHARDRAHVAQGSSAITVSRQAASGLPESFSGFLKRHRNEDLRRGQPNSKTHGLRMPQPPKAVVIAAVKVTIQAAVRLIVLILFSAPLSWNARPVILPVQRQVALVQRIEATTCRESVAQWPPDPARRRESPSSI